jgi:uncharacterized membrane protein
MSGQPLLSILPLLSIVLFHTHYGWVWLLRPVALTALWMGWWMGKHRLRSRLFPALMFGAGALMAMTRSASGHAADWGDLTFPELIDWLHLMASALWGGGLIPLSLVVLPAALKHPEQRQVIATVARRFSLLAGFALAGILLTGLYNAWLQVGTLSAMWKTPYGQTLLAKLCLLMPVLILGVFNRYISVPLLQQWAGRPLPTPLLVDRLPVIRRLITDRLGPHEMRLGRQFRRKVLTEAIVVGGILMCTALLLHGTSGRHDTHMDHGGAAPALQQSSAIHADLPPHGQTSPVSSISPPPAPLRGLPGHAFDDAELRRRVGGDDARQLETGAGEQGAIFRLSTVAPLIHD